MDLPPNQLNLTNLRHVVYDTLGTAAQCVLTKVRCPDFRGCNAHKQGVWDSQLYMYMHVYMYMYIYIVHTCTYTLFIVI